jgi:hypothetical protein
MYIIIDSSLIYLDTLYTNAILNCDLDLTFPVTFDTVYLDTTYLVDSTHLYCSWVFVQDTIETSLGGTYYIDTIGNFWVVVDVYCDSRSVGKYFTLNAALNQLSFTIGYPESNAVNNQKISVYPNPFNQNIITEFYLDGNNQTNIEIFDLSGRLLYEMHLQTRSGKNTISLPLEHISDGTYIIHVKTSDRILGIQKIIKN